MRIGYYGRISEKETRTKKKGLCLEEEAPRLVEL